MGVVLGRVALARYAGVEDNLVAGAHFQAVAAVRGLKKEDVAANQSQHALYGRRYVFVKDVRKLYDDHGAITGRSHESTGDHPATFAPKLAQHDVHDSKLAQASLLAKLLKVGLRNFSAGVSFAFKRL